MKVPPKIITEGSNELMRITGSAGDKESIPTSHPDRNRSTVRFTKHQSSMPVISESTQRQTYSARIRYRELPTGNSGVTFELFQYAPNPGVYGTRDSNGPVVQIWRRAEDGHVRARANYANETKGAAFDLGFVGIGQWHTYMVKAVWSHDPSKGRIAFYFDGALKGTVSGRDVCLGPDANRIPMFKLGMYGDFAVGAIDVDDVKALPGT